jgi:hypothetical protein
MGKTSETQGIKSGRIKNIFKRQKQTNLFLVSVLLLEPLNLIKCSINELSSFIEHQVVITISNSYLSIKKNWGYLKKIEKSGINQMMHKRNDFVYASSNKKL